MLGVSFIFSACFASSSSEAVTRFTFDTDLIVPWIFGTAVLVLGFLALLFLCLDFWHCCSCAWIFGTTVLVLGFLALQFL